MRGALLGSLLLALIASAACDAPAEALVQRCGVYNVLRPVECEFEARLVRDHVWAYVDTYTKNHHVQVTGSFTIDQGHVAVVLFGCEDEARNDVKPGAPTKIDCVSTVNRNDFTVGIDAYSFGGDAKGLRGQLTFVPR